VAVLLAGGWSLCVPGCFSIDEATLLLSARSVALGHGVEVWNGFEETGSLALAPGWLKPVGGRLVSQYPDFFPLLALPAFRAFGLRGLMLVNLVALLGVAWLTWKLAVAHFDRRSAWAAVLLLVPGSFALEYGVGAWPHMTSALFVLATLALVERALRARTPLRVAAWCAAAGCVGGIGVGVRLDVAFGLAAVALALLLRGERRWLELLAFSAGAMPPLAALALLNQVKFGQLTPFTYGPSYGIATGAGPFVPFAVAAITLAILLSWLLRRVRSPGARARATVVAVGLLAVVVLVAPAPRRALGAAASGVAQLALDLRLRGADHPDSEPGRELGVPVRHFGALKKALVQSCPWLVLGAIPPWIALRRGEGRSRLWLWSSVPLAYVLVYGVFAWDGGLALNQRYFVPALPLLALLGGRGLEWIRELARCSPGVVVGLAGATSAVLFVLAPRLGAGTRAETLVLLDLPLALAGVTALALVVAGRPAARLATRRLALAAAAAAVGFAVFSCQLWDLTRTLDRRARFAAAGDRVRAERPGEALLLSEPTVALASAIDAASRARLANPSHDFYRTFGPLVDYHLAAGHRVLLSVPPERYGALVDAGLERIYRVRGIADAEVPIFELLAIETSGTGATR
jgi:hypothetical protein